MTVQESDKLANARAQGQAQFDSLREMVAEWRCATDDDVFADRAEELAEAACKTGGWEMYGRQGDRALLFRKAGEDDFAGCTWGDLAEYAGIEFRPDRDAVVDAIQNDALSVEVRSGWHMPGDVQGLAPTEYCILLCTGGPACRIVGDLNEHGEPTSARMEVQDWFTPWTEIRPKVSADDYDAEPIMLEYARQFYFGEG